MPYILCVYYSRTGHTEKLVREIAQELKCECVKLDDGVDRSGLTGWLRSGMQAMARQVPDVGEIKTAGVGGTVQCASAQFFEKVWKTAAAGGLSGYKGQRRAV